MPPVDRNRDYDRDDEDSDEFDSRSRASRKVGAPLQRGSACLSCRKRKMKCDATKPICRQCVKANRADECEYDDGRQKSRTQILQEKIAKLEDRIRELEQSPDGFSDEIGIDPGDEGIRVLDVEGGLHMNLGDIAHGGRLPYGSGGSGDLLFGLDTEVFGHGAHHSPNFSGSGSASASTSSSTYSPSAFALPPSSFQHGVPPIPGPVSANVPAGILDSRLGKSPSPMFFGVPPSSPGSSSGSGDVSRSRNGHQHSHNNSWQPSQVAPDNFVPFTSHNPHENSLTGSPFGVDVLMGGLTFTPGPSSSASTSWVGSSGGNLGNGHGTHQYGLGMTQSGRPQQQHRWEAVDLAPQDRKMLLDIFLPHARQCGFDMHIGRLKARLGMNPWNTSYLTLSPPLSPHSSQYAQQGTAHPALANAIYLLACHFSASPAASALSTKNNAPMIASPNIPNLSSMEDHFLSKALRGIAAALEAGELEHAQYQLQSQSTQPEADSSSTRASPLVDAVQASALLAVYFFGKARLLEGYYHASAAARLAIALGLHQVRSPMWSSTGSNSGHSSPDLAASIPSVTDSSTGPMPGFDTSSIAEASSSGAWSGSATPQPSVPLPPARSSLEHAERVSVFWQVFCVDRCWSVATGLPSSLPDDEHPQLRICSVWPWNITEQVMPEKADCTSLSTLYNPNTPLPSDSKQTCVKALKSRAAAFFERAARIASVQGDPKQWDQACQLEFALQRFASALPDITATFTSSGGGFNITESVGGTTDTPSAAIFGASGPVGQSAMSSTAPLAAPSLALNETLHFQATADVAMESRHEAQASRFPSPANASSSISDACDPSGVIDPELLVVHTLVHVATVQLFHPFTQKDGTAHMKCLRAARAVTALVRRMFQVASSVTQGHARGDTTGPAVEGLAVSADADTLVALLDPIIGTCWMCAADVFVREKMWNGAGANAVGTAMPSSSQNQIHDADEEIDIIVSALKIFGRTFPVALFQAQKVEQSRKTL